MVTLVSCRLAIGGGIIPPAMGNSLGTIPTTAFALLLTSEVISYMFCAVGPTRHFAYLRVPAMVVHAAALLYYIWVPFAGVCTYTDAFGRPLHPMRYVMWTVSVTLMTTSVRRPHIYRRPT